MRLWHCELHNVIFMLWSGVQFLLQRSSPEFLINQKMGNLGSVTAAQNNISAVVLYISCFFSISNKPAAYLTDTLFWASTVVEAMGWWQQRELVKRTTTLAFMRNEYADDWRYAVQRSTGIVRCLPQMHSPGAGMVVWEWRMSMDTAGIPFTQHSYFHWKVFDKMTTVVLCVCSVYHTAKMVFVYNVCCLKLKYGFKNSKIVCSLHKTYTIHKASLCVPFI